MKLSLSISFRIFISLSLTCINTVLISQPLKAPELYVASGTPLRIDDLDFSYSGQYLAATGVGPQVKIWDTQEEQEVRTLFCDKYRDLTSRISLRFANTKNLLLTHVEKHFTLWNIINGEKIGEFATRSARVVNFFFSGDDSKLFFSTADSVFIYNFKSKSYTLKICLPFKNATYFNYSQISNLLISANTNNIVFINSSGTIVTSHTRSNDKISNVTTSGNGVATFVKTSTDSLVVWIQETPPNIVSRWLMSSKSAGLEVDQTGRFFTTRTNGRVAVWHFPSKSLVYEFPKDMPNSRIKYSRHTDQIALANFNDIRIAALGDKSMRRRLLSPVTLPGKMQIFNNALYISAGSKNKLFRLDSKNSYEPLRSLEGAFNFFVSPDESFLATVKPKEDSSVLTIRQMSISKKLWETSIAENSNDIQIDFSTDGSMVAFGCRQLEIRESSSGKNLKVLANVPEGFRITDIDVKPSSNVIGFTYASNMPGQGGGFKIYDWRKRKVLFEQHNQLTSAQIRKYNQDHEKSVKVLLKDGEIDFEKADSILHPDFIKRHPYIASERGERNGFTSLVFSPSGEKFCVLNDSAVWIYSAVDFQLFGSAKNIEGASGDAKWRGKTIYVSEHNNSITKISSERPHLQESFEVGPFTSYEINSDSTMCFLSRPLGYVEILKNFTNKIATICLVGDSSWVVVTPDGRFDGSAEALTALGWRLDHTNRIWPLETFYNSFFLPNVLDRILQNKLPPAHFDLISASRIPSLRIMLKNGDVEIRHDNGKDFLCFKQDQSTLSAFNFSPQEVKQNLQGCKCTVPINGAAYANQLAPSKENNKNTVFTDSENKIKDHGVLHILTIAVGNYGAASGLDPLPSSVSSAKNFLSKFTKERTGLHFREIRIWPSLFDIEATRQNIIYTLGQLAAAALPNDAVILYFIGHGKVPLEIETFYFVPSDGNLDEMANSCISTSLLVDLLRPLHARRLLMIFDACQSGGVVEPLVKVAEAKIGLLASGEVTDGGIGIISSTTPLQYAGQQTTNANTVFNSTLLNALNSKHSRPISVRSIIAYIKEHLPKRSEELGLLQSPVLFYSGNDFPLLSFDK